MFLPSEVLSEVFSSISRQQLADLQLVSREFDSIIAAKVYPLHVIEDICITYQDNTKDFAHLYLCGPYTNKNSIDLDAAIGSAPIPSYLRFLHIWLANTYTFTPHFMEQLTRLENAFDGGELTFDLMGLSHPYGLCKTEHDVRLKTLNVIEKMTPVFHKVRDVKLCFCMDNEWIFLPMGPEDDINILSTPLLLNCRSLYLVLDRLSSTHRLGLLSPTQVVDWLFPAEEREGRYMVLCVNEGAEAILTDFISKKVELKNERDCEVVVGLCPEDWNRVSRDPTDLVSKRAKSMIERPDDVVVEFFRDCGCASRLFKYRRRITDK